MLKKFKYAITCAFLGVTIATCSTTSGTEGGDDSLPPPAPTIEQRIASIATTLSLPSVATAVVSADSIIWESYTGLADVENGVAANDETIYTVASISKLVTATAVMQLVEQNQIDLDADINHYLGFSARSPNFNDTPITTRMLLTHRAGLSAPASGVDANFYVPFQEETAPQLGTWIENYLQQPVAWIQSGPGATENYSNHGAALLGHIVAQVSGMDFREYCKQFIFEPLGMNSTSFNLADLDESKMAVPYHNGPYTQYSVPYYPATTVKTSISDFSKFVRLYLNHGTYDGTQILQRETVTEMLRPQNANSSLGFLWWTYNQGWKGHGGAYYGSTTFMDLNLGQNKGVIVFTNITQWHLADPNVVYPGGELYQLLHDHASGL